MIGIRVLFQKGAALRNACSCWRAILRSTVYKIQVYTYPFQLNAVTVIIATMNA